MSEGTVLIVDDSPIALRALQALFMGAGYTVITASSGAGALVELELAAADLVVTDILMPGMDGYELCRRIRAQTACRMVPIIAVTEAAELEAKLRGFEAGVDDFVGKEAVGPELLARAHALLVRQRSLSTSSAPPAAPPRRRQVMVFFSLRGGAGTSTLAVNVALLLARQRGETVALLDLALQSGATEVLLNVVPRVDLGTLAADDVDIAALSRADVRRLVAMANGDVALLAAPRHPEDAERVSAQFAAAALEALAATYGTVIVDAPNAFTEPLLSVLDVADLVVTIATPDVVGAKSGVAALHVLNGLGISRERQMLVLNRPNGEGGLDPKQLETAVGAVLTAAIPYDAGFGRALNTGEPPVLQQERRPRASVTALVDLVRQIEQRQTAATSS
jgi:pilus assembly protein CpaE